MHYSGIPRSLMINWVLLIPSAIFDVKSTRIDIRMVHNTFKWGESILKTGGKNFPHFLCPEIFIKRSNLSE